MGKWVVWLLVAIAVVFTDTARTEPVDWPKQPVRFVVPYAPGSSGDIAARKIAPLVGARINQSVIIENRTGATGSVGMDSVASAPADGHTFAIASDIQSAVLPAFRSHTRTDYDKVFVPVAPLVFVDMVVAATPALQANSFVELVRLAKASPGKINYGSTGIGSGHQLIMEYLKSLGGFDVFHVPYRSTPAALADLAGGRIDVMFGAFSTVRGLVEQNKLKVLAVGGLQRNPRLPSVLTLSESGFPGVEYYAYWSVAARAETPSGIITRMRQAVLEATNDPEIKAWFSAVGLSHFNGGMEGLAARTKSDRERWEKVIALNKIELP